MTRLSEFGGLDLDPDQRFAMAVARAFARGDSPEQISTELPAYARDVASWDRVERLLHVHRCRAVSYVIVSDRKVQETGAIPASFLESTRDAYRGSFTKSMLEPQVLHRAVAGLAAADVPAFAIKGIVLGKWLYGDEALREHDDIDLLVPLNVAADADRALRDLGYQGGYRPPMYPGKRRPQPATRRLMGDPD